jgi:hypothetical protein
MNEMEMQLLSNTEQSDLGCSTTSRGDSKHRQINFSCLLLVDVARIGSDRRPWVRRRPVGSAGDHRSCKLRKFECAGTRRANCCWHGLQQGERRGRRELIAARHQCIQWKCAPSFSIYLALALAMCHAADVTPLLFVTTSSVGVQRSRQLHSARFQPVCLLGCLAPQSTFPTSSPETLNSGLAWPRHFLTPARHLANFGAILCTIAKFTSLYFDYKNSRCHSCL